MKTIAGLEVVMIARKMPMVRTHDCVLASDDETWWQGPIADAPHQVQNCPKADRIVFYAEDMALVEAAFKVTA